MHSILLKESPVIGDALADGTLYAGVSPDTGRPMYTTPQDARRVMEWRHACQYAARLAAYGHADWRIPTRAELDVLFWHRLAIGNFRAPGLWPRKGNHAGGWYWSSSTADHAGVVWRQHFTAGQQEPHPAFLLSAVRCVRG